MPQSLDVVVVLSSSEACTRVPNKAYTPSNDALFGGVRLIRANVRLFGGLEYPDGMETERAFGYDMRSASDFFETLQLLEFHQRELEFHQRNRLRRGLQELL